MSDQNDSPHHYEAHRDRQMAEARDSFQAWWERLPPARKAALTRAGITGPVSDSNVGNLREEDAALLAESSYATRMDEQVDRFPDELVEKFHLRTPVAELLAEWMTREIAAAAIRYQSWLFNRVVGEFLNTTNPKLCAAGLAFAADLAALNNLGSQAAYARRLHLSRSAVSKMTKWWQRELRLVPSAHQKREAACKTYSAVATADHWRRRKATPENLARLTQRFQSSNESNGTSNGSSH